MPDVPTEAETVASLRITPELHFRFASFSGDRNPMHTDAVFARRTLPGSIAAYGMQMLLWALDTLAARGRIGDDLRRIRVRFVRWIYLNDTVRLIVAHAAAGKLRAELYVDETLAVTVDLSGTPADVTEPLQPHTLQPHRTAAADLDLQAISEQYGTVPTCDLHVAAQLFPALARIFGPALASSIATVSYVVGMEAPGLHSIDSRADWTVTPLQQHAPAHDDTFTFHVAAVDDRFRLARIAVRSSSLSGTVEALVRRPPVSQALLASLQSRVQPCEFRRVRALVVGGSRGVGEAIAKLLLVGGAHVTLTYAQGYSEANELADQAAQLGLCLTTAHLDVLDPGVVIPHADEPWTHLFYCATGSMFRSRTAADAARLTQEMHAFYVEGLDRILHQVMRMDSPPAQRESVPSIGEHAANDVLTVFVPSTDLFDAECDDHAELCAAKLAAEELCQQWSGTGKVTAITERLPRMRTDQTASVLPQQTADPADTMLPILRRIAAS